MKNKWIKKYTLTKEIDTYIAKNIKFPWKLIVIFIRQTATQITGNYHGSDNSPVVNRDQIKITSVFWRISTKLAVSKGCFIYPK